MLMEQSNSRSHLEELGSRQSARALAEQAFSRAAGTRLVSGNRVQLLINADQNYPAWLAAIASAREHVHFESYIIHEDSAGLEFGDALIAKAQQGVRVRLIYDWMGAIGKTSRKFGTACELQVWRCVATIRHISIHRWAGSHVTIARCLPWMAR